MAGACVPPACANDLSLASTEQTGRHHASGADRRSNPLGMPIVIPADLDPPHVWRGRATPVPRFPSGTGCPWLEYVQ